MKSNVRIKRKSPRDVCNRLISVIFFTLTMPDNLISLILRYQFVAFRLWFLSAHRNRRNLPVNARLKPNTKQQMPRTDNEVLKNSIIKA